MKILTITVVKNASRRSNIHLILYHAPRWHTRCCQWCQSCLDIDQEERWQILQALEELSSDRECPRCPCIHAPGVDFSLNQFININFIKNIVPWSPARAGQILLKTCLDCLMHPRPTDSSSIIPIILVIPVILSRGSFVNCCFSWDVIDWELGSQGHSYSYYSNLLIHFIKQAEKLKSGEIKRWSKAMKVVMKMVVKVVTKVERLILRLSGVLWLTDG